MKQNIILLISHIVGIFAFTGLACVAHGVYDRFPKNWIAAMFPVNESPWEHSKLFYIPAVILFLAEYLIIGRNFGNYFFAHSLALIIMPAAMLIIHYIYVGFKLKISVAYGIVVTVLTILIGMIFAYQMTIAEIDFSKNNMTAIALLVLLVIVYTVFTFYPPRIGLFYDKMNYCYSIVDTSNKDVNT